MTWESVPAAVWAFLNSPLGITAVAAVVLYLLRRLYAAHPAWEDYEGAIISAVKFAEKQVPDDAGDTATARFQAALAYVLRIYEEIHGKAPDAQTQASLEEGIRLKHADLEALGTLSSE